MEQSSEETLTRLAIDIDLYYEQMVLLYWHQLKAFIARRVESPQDAEDLVQEVFIRAYVALERYTIPQRQTLKVRAWLYKIAWNICCNFAKRAKPSALLSLHISSDEETEMEIEDERSENPADIFEQAESRQELEALVAALPQHYRVVVSLYYFDQLNYQEIADMLHQPLGTVKVYVHRGIKLLRKAFTAPVNEAG